MNKFQIFLGLTVLILGGLFYLTVRSPGSLCYTNYHISNNLIAQLQKGSISILINAFPAFAHVFSFSLLTSGLIGNNSRKSCALICTSWLLLNLIFEIGQYPISKYRKLGEEVLIMIPGMNPDWNLFQRISLYFENGIYDLFDIFASLVGSFTAYFAIRVTNHQCSHDPNVPY
jgi:hypothetical protein